MSDNGYLSNLAGCTLQISGAAISSGGCMLTTPAATGLDKDITLTSGGIVTIGTTFPADLSSAYQVFLSDKQTAIYSGGSCVYAGNVQSFSAGSSYSAFCDTHLMTLNGVQGSLEQGNNENTYKSNISFLPAVGFWVETDPVTDLDKAPGKQHVVASVFRVLKPCVTCEDYNALFVMEMILYHAINKVAWKILHTIGDYSTNNHTTPGLWAQYQGALYRWNANTYVSQYAYSLDTAGDTFVFKIGWINTTCSPGAAFAAFADITNTFTPVEGDPDYRHYHLLYGGSPVIKGAVSPNAVAFIANTATNQIYYLTPDTLSAELLAHIGTPTTLSDLLAYTAVTSVQAFNIPENTGSWRVGVVCANMTGDSYGAVAFQLGFAQRIDDQDVIDVSSADKWTYTISPTWKTTRDGVTIDTYSKNTENAIVNGIVTYTEPSS